MRTLTPPDLIVSAFSPTLALTPRTRLLYRTADGKLIHIFLNYKNALKFIGIISLGFIFIAVVTGFSLSEIIGCVFIFFNWWR